MPTILTINSGSSSLKLGLYHAEDTPPMLIYQGATDNIGKAHGSLVITDGAGRTIYQEDASHDSQPSAFQHAATKINELAGSTVAGIGHRIVHGGPRLRQHCRITSKVLDELRAAVHFAPLHIPPALQLIDTATRMYPGVPNFACFDTAFHTTLPPEAYTYPIPFRFRELGVQRYGFHGLSYESVVAALEPNVPVRMVASHLGNGCSLCAIANGRSVDTSMGLTPAGGIPMSTRPGDLDPGVVTFMAREGKMDADQLDSTLNHDCGLRGLSASADAPGISDMRDLTAAAEQGSETARLALTIFCRAIAKTVASYAVVLGSLDCLVFTGGIGEHSALVRAEVCRLLRFLGLATDDDANRRNAAILSMPQSAVMVRVLTANEDGRIAVHVQALLDGN